jgi:hypothetical protein
VLNFFSVISSSTVVKQCYNIQRDVWLVHMLHQGHTFKEGVKIGIESVTKTRMTQEMAVLLSPNLG